MPAIDDPERWRTCRIGIRIANAGMLLFVPLMSFVALAATCGIYGWIKPGQDAASLMAVAVVFAFGLMGVGGLAHFIGQVICCGTPSPRDRWAFRSLGLLGVVVLLAIVLGVFALTQTRPRGALVTSLVLVGFGAAIGMVALAAFCSWIAYLRDVAEAFGAEGLVSQLQGIMLGQLLLFAVAVIAAAFPATPRLDDSGATPLFDVVSAWAQVAVTVWYGVTLGGLNRVLADAIDGRASPWLSSP